MLVAGGYDPRALATIDWLASRHDVPVSAYTVAMVRFGGERLLSRPPRAGRASPRPRQRGRLAALGRRTRRVPPTDDDGYTERRPARASLAEEQAEDAPELVRAPRDRRAAAHPHDRRALGGSRGEQRRDRGALASGTASRMPGSSTAASSAAPAAGSRARIGRAGHGGRSATAARSARRDAAEQPGVDRERAVLAGHARVEREHRVAVGERQRRASSAGTGRGVAAASRTTR